MTSTCVEFQIIVKSDHVAVVAPGGYEIARVDDFFEYRMHHSHGP